MSKKKPVVKTEVVMTATASLDEEVKKELAIPDPSLEESVAVLNKALNEHEKTFKFFTSLNKKEKNEDSEEHDGS